MSYLPYSNFQTRELESFNYFILVMELKSNQLLPKIENIVHIIRPD